MTAFAGVNSATPLQAAKLYLDEGFHPVPVPYRSKKPILEGWPALRATHNDLPELFGSTNQNIGIILGDEFGTTDVDCDTNEAVIAARLLLPATGMRFGRASKRASHYFYRSDPPTPSARFKDPTDDKMLVELRSRKKDGGTGFHTVVPPSVHKDSGERIEFEPGGDGYPANIDADTIHRAVAHVAAAALLARHWPQKGSRHNAMLALAGGLWRVGWSLDNAKEFCRAVYRAVQTHDPEALTRSDHEAEDTYRRGAEALARGGEARITGWPTLAGIVGDTVISAAALWLDACGGGDLGTETPIASAPPPEQSSPPHTAAGATDSKGVATPHQPPADDTATASMFNRLAPYPAPMGKAAYHGVIGEFVRAVEPHTEADSNVLIALALTYAGNLLGRHAYISVGGQKHHTNIFVTAVGTSSSGRKGSAYGPLDLFFGEVDPDWARNNQSGLSSGEGLIWCVRDAIYKREKSKKEGAANTYEEVMVDPGVEDKRALVKQSEFFGALQVMRRPGNTLSPTIRDVFDTGNLRSLTKNDPAKATGAHISIAANITKEELLRGMLGGEMDNGFANRIMWACSKRSKELPEGGRLSELTNSETWRNLVMRVQKAKAHAFNAGTMSRDEEASDAWGRDASPEKGAYHELTAERHGLFGAVTSRAAPLVLRLSLIYALLDCSRVVRLAHLEAALEVWRYCEDSAKYIFGDALGDPTADTILSALRKEPGGLTRLEISKLLGGNQNKPEIERALMVLHKGALARFVNVEKDGKGRKAQRWFAISGGGTVQL